MSQNHKTELALTSTLNYVGNVCDMSPKCLRDMTLSPNLGDMGHVTQHLPTQSLFKGLSHVSGPSVISLPYKYMHTCEEKRESSSRWPRVPIFALPHNKTRQWDFRSSRPSSPSISVSSWSFEPRVGSLSSHPLHQCSVLDAPSKDRLVVVL